MIGTRQYRKMENDSTNILKNKELRDIVAARETGERETNAPNQFEAPRAAEERETNVSCQRKTAEDAGTRETNVSEREAAAVRRDKGFHMRSVSKYRLTSLFASCWVSFVLDHLALN